MSLRIVMTFFFIIATTHSIGFCLFLQLQIKSMNTFSFIKNTLPKDSKIRGMLYFMAVIVITHVVWKVVISGNEEGHEIALFGQDISSFFFRISLFTAKISGWVMNNLLGQNFSVDGVVIYLNEKRQGVMIIWACSGVKQCYMFVCLILLYPGISWIKRTLFALFGCVVLEIFNILRISIVAIGTKHDVDNFDSLHSSTQYLFYVVMFFLWVYWMNKVLKTVNCSVSS